MLWIGSNQSAMFLTPRSGGLVPFSLPKSTPILTLLDGQAPLRILGRTRYDTADQLSESVTSNFMLSALNAKTTSERRTTNQCLAFGQTQHWSGIAVTLSGAGRDSDAMLATRVRSQINACLKRLERLSTAYRTTMAYAGSSQAPSRTTYTGGAYAEHLGVEYRSCINELYSLRDAISSAAFRLVFGRSDPFDMRKMRAAVKVLESEAALLIDRSMFDTEGDLLIDKMSLYRSIALHCLGATNPVVHDVYQLRESTGPFGGLYYLVYPLYDDMAKMREIEQGSSKGILTPAPRSEVERFFNLPEHLDALDFSFDCFVRLLRICELVGDEAGIEPTVTTIKEEEILELRWTDENGVTRYFKRDKTTGKLVEQPAETVLPDD